MARVPILAIVICTLLGGCAGYSRVTEYPPHLAKNITEEVVNGKRFLIKHHPQDDTILIQPTSGAAAMAGLKSGLTLGIVSTSAASAPWSAYKAAAESYAAHHGCKVDALYQLESVSYEARLICPSA